MQVTIVKRYSAFGSGIYSNDSRAGESNLEDGHRASTPSAAVGPGPRSKWSD
jgi:hypothetical protein